MLGSAVEVIAWFASDPGLLDQAWVADRQDEALLAYRAPIVLAFFGSSQVAWAGPFLLVSFDFDSTVGQVDPWFVAVPCWGPSAVPCFAGS